MLVLLANKNIKYVEEKRKIIKYLRDDDEYTESFELEIRKIIEYK